MDPNCACWTQDKFRSSFERTTPPHQVLKYITVGPNPRRSFSQAPPSLGFGFWFQDIAIHFLLTGTYRPQHAQNGKTLGRAPSKRISVTGDTSSVNASRVMILPVSICISPMYCILAWLFHKFSTFR